MRWPRSPTALAVGVFLVAAIVGLSWTLVGAGPERGSLDVRYQLRPRHPADHRVVVVGLDDTTITDAQLRPPFPRSIPRLLLRRLTEAKAAAVAYDVAFVGLTDPDSDRELVRAFEKAPRPVAAVAGIAQDIGMPEPLAGIERFDKIRVRPGNTLRDDDEKGSWTAFPTSTAELDSFPAAAAAAFLDRARVRVPDGALIDYPGPSGTIPAFSMSAVLDRAVPVDRLRGKVVVIGDTAPILHDVHRAPVDGSMYGVEIQAAAIATALDGFPLRRASPSVAALTTLGLAAAVPAVLALLLLVGRRRPTAGRLLLVPDLEAPGSMAIGLVGLALVGGWSLAAQAAFNHGTAVGYTPGLAAILAGSAAAYLAARRAERAAYMRLRFDLAEGEVDVLDRALRAGAESGPISELTNLVRGYEIVGRLAVGGMGVVYLAKQTLIGRPVALKVIKRSLVTTPGHRARFVQEAQALAQMWHPHVVPIFTVEDDDGVLFIAMRYIDGDDLEKTGRLGPDEVVTIVDAIADALDAAHREGIVHGDVKADNIILEGSDAERAYLVDFGIASLTATLEVPFGFTPQYAAPELHAGDPAQPSSDIYALGVLAFFLLTGTLPFEGDDAVLRAAHRTAPRPAVSDRRPELPEHVDPVLRRVMAIDPAERYTSAGAFATALRRALRER